MGAYDEEQPRGGSRFRVLIGCAVVVAIGGGVWFAQKRINQSARSRQDQNLVMVNLPLPPPPPAPPPPPPPKIEQKMIEQEPVNEQETKPDTTPASEAPALVAGFGGNGPADSFNLPGGKNGGSGTGPVSNRVRNSRWGWYANEVQKAIAQVLQSNPHTRIADFRSVVKIWADRAGRITHARLAGSTGNVALDNAITNEVLAGLVLHEPPPEGMPMPIVLRLTARHSQMALSR